MINITPYVRDSLENKSMLFTDFYLMQGKTRKAPGFKYLQLKCWNLLK